MNLEKKPLPVQYNYNLLDLTEDEARVIRTLVGMVYGKSRFRKICDEIWHKMNELKRIEYQHGSIDGDLFQL